MTDAFRTTSLANTGRTYVQGQMTAEGYSGLHFQVLGPASNRSYGLAFNTQITPIAERALEAANQQALSLAGTEKVYAVVRIKPVSGGIVTKPRLHVQVWGDQVNRPYGAAFDVPVSDEVVEAIQNLR